MRTVICPHCKTHRIFTSKIPRDVIIIMPCPACHEWVVLLQNRALAVSRKILIHGTMEERHTHIATIIDKFLEQATPVDAEENDLATEFTQLREMLESQVKQLPMNQAPSTPITDDEIIQFVREDLCKIDDTQYFKQHFG